MADIEAAHAALLARGAKNESDPHVIARMPDHDLWISAIRDPEGNIIELMSEVRSGSSARVTVSPMSQFSASQSSQPSTQLPNMKVRGGIRIGSWYESWPYCSQLCFEPDRIVLGSIGTNIPSERKN